MTIIDFNRARAALTIITVQAGSKALSTCKKTAKFAGLCVKKAVNAPFLVKKIFNKKATVENSPIQQEITVPYLGDLNPLTGDFSQILKKSITSYKKGTGKIGDLAEKIASKGPSLEKMPSLDQVDFWKSLDPTLRLTQKHFPKVFLGLTGRNRNEKEITEKLESLLPCLQKFSLPHFKLPTKFTASDIASVDSMIKKLKLIDKKIVTFIQEATAISENEQCMLIEALDSISELQSLLKEYQEDVNRPINEEDKKFAKNILKNNPLLTKLAPLAVISSGSMVTALTIDQEGLLPAGLNPSRLISKTISKTIGLVADQISSVGDSFIFQNLISAASPQNVTMTAGTCALAVFSYTDEEEQSGYSRYVVDTLVNQVFMFTFAYVGARVCGSKVKVKEFVDNRISNVLMYNACNTALKYLGIPFWPNKVVSSIASGITNPLIHFVTEGS